MNPVECEAIDRLLDDDLLADEAAALVQRLDPTTSNRTAGPPGVRFGRFAAIPEAAPGASWPWPTSIASDEAVRQEWTRWPAILADKTVEQPPAVTGFVGSAHAIDDRLVRIA